MQETLNAKKKGDVAFRHKDLRAAIECYTQVKFNLQLFFFQVLKIANLKKTTRRLIVVLF